MGEVKEKTSGGGRESEATGTPHPRKPRKIRQGLLFVLVRANHHCSKPWTCVPGAGFVRLGRLPERGKHKC